MIAPVAAPAVYMRTAIAADTNRFSAAQTSQRATGIRPQCSAKLSIKGFPILQLTVMKHANAKQVTETAIAGIPVTSGIPTISCVAPMSCTHRRGLGCVGRARVAGEAWRSDRAMATTFRLATRYNILTRTLGGRRTSDSPCSAPLSSSIANKYSLAERVTSIPFEC